jgi:AAA+ superfamily predicted ATPase
MQTPAARIGIAVLGAIVLIIVLVFIVRGCQRSQLEDSYSSYMGDVTTIVTASGKEADSLQEILQNKMSAIAMRDGPLDDKIKEAMEVFEEVKLPEEERQVWLESLA